MDKIVTLRLNEMNQKALLEIQKFLLERTPIGEHRWHNQSSLIRQTINRYWQAIDLGIADKIDQYIDDAQASSGKGVCWLREMDARREQTDRAPKTHAQTYTELPPQEDD